MKLLLSQQTLAQRTALTNLFNRGQLVLYELCDCQGQVRHNNGGNYHRIVSFQMDAGKIFRSETSTSDYSDPDDWIETSFTVAIEEIVDLSAQGYRE